MTLDAKWEIKLNPAARDRTKVAIFAGVREVFEIDIKAEAKTLSPVSPTYPSIPESRGEKRIDQGTNRRSIDTDVTEEAGGVRAQLYTQSGYGAYLELGTKRMIVRPYLWPAFQKFRKKLIDIIGEKIRRAGA